MSYNQYSGYGGNPYGEQQGGYSSSNPYASDAGNPYGAGYGQVGVVVLENQWIETLTKAHVVEPPTANGAAPGIDLLGANRWITV
jgi:syntaxin 1B/2/3